MTETLLLAEHLSGLQRASKPHVSVVMIVQSAKDQTPAMNSELQHFNHRWRSYV
jgi:hypothetical protein